MSADLGHWRLAPGLEFNPEAYGFIYEITNNALPSPKKYIGKKQCRFKIKRKPLKGKTRKRLDTKESDWKTYMGSSKELQKDIDQYGKQNFNFVILEWCNSKFELGYKEIKRQIQEDVLLKDEYYNGIINCRLGRAPKDFILNENKNIS